MGFVQHFSSGKPDGREATGVFLPSYLEGALSALPRALSLRMLRSVTEPRGPWADALLQLDPVSSSHILPFESKSLGTAQVKG